MKIAIRIFALGALILFSAPVAGEEPPTEFIELAVKLKTFQLDLLDKKLKNDFEGVYNLQHPLFRKKVTLDEFKFFDGQTVHNSLEMHPMHISGGSKKFKEFINKNKQKTDALGNPSPPAFKVSIMPGFRPKTKSVEMIEISRDKKLARVNFKMAGKAIFPPQIWRGFKLMDWTEQGTDYWEKVDGKWVITVLKHEATISGAKSAHIFIPDQTKLWDTMDFVAVDPKKLSSSAP